MYRLLATTSLVVCAVPALAQEDAPAVFPSATATYSPYLSEDYPNQVFFGDTHLHTSYSADAGMIGNTLGPADAYLFAKGEAVVSSMGVPARLARPLDFLVVADHSEGLGVSPLLAEANPIVTEEPFGAKLFALLQVGDSPGAYDLWRTGKIDRTNTLADNEAVSEIAWEQITEAAETASTPGAFTAFIGYEWTSMPNGNNLHRVVVYRDGKALADRMIPLSSDRNPDPEALWEWMQTYEDETGGKLLAIPHNGNVSNGLMFDDVTLSGGPLTEDYAAARMRWEPLYEVTQMKGDGETHPFLSTDDAFADFETWDKGSFGPAPKTPEMLPREYAREAYKRGLAYEAALGRNPFKFGMIGSTDSHTSLSTTQENNFFGKISALEPTSDPIRMEEVITGRGSGPEGQQRAWQTSAAGLAAVWARENTREALWDAMARKEVYATTGTRIRVRVFAGYDFEKTDLPRADFDAHGYANGVPMGSDLAVDADGRAPRLMVRALRDPDGANLDRIQIVKGWLNADGTTAERVYDIACGGRALVPEGCDGAVGNTVDAANATWTNDIGQAILAGFWEDPEFDAAQRAFYYVRVLEIPTPRWTTYDAKVFGIEIPDGAPASIQERAYTSPIWYTP
ncbi:MAG: hypothetical protein VR71_04220 [Roseovarius sp. BRH_c41]|uniref:DUF3604 domain-containing protein n=1 Tax=Roseovarius sp. BRH_c41 TaxID=1629709 RepID=UPI0005F201B8|nr:DUF3604 domain-containing protein [Roseovarius sp. BRH_c41]KJS44830.1 MAG: hypothetical protein VR71_04220 [Roseovarius sp. BRH_c41]